MRARAKLRPGQPGTKALVKQYGERLVCVRYRYDATRLKRYKTVELIVDERDWVPPTRPDPDAIVYIRVAPNEYNVQKQLRAVGAIWNRRARLWEVQRKLVERLKLQDRLVQNKDGPP